MTKTSGTTGQPIIDMHAHTSYDDVSTADKLVSAAAELGVSRMLLLGDVIAFGYHPTEDQVRRINDGNAKSVQRHPEVFEGLCFINPENSKRFVREEIRRCVETLGFCGVKLEACINCRSKRLDAVMESVRDHGVFLLHHSWYNVLKQTPTESTPADIASLASRYPDVPIVMAHLGGARIRGVQDILPHENITIDTSGSQPIGGLVEYAVRVLGAHRVVYGSDVPGRDFSAQLGRIYGARISTADRERVLHRNAERLLSLRKGEST